MHKKTRQPEELEPLPDLHKCKGTHTADFSSAPQGQYTRFFPFSQAHLLSRNRIATCWFSGTSAFCLLSVRFFLCLFHTVRRVFFPFSGFQERKEDVCLRGVFFISRFSPFLTIQKNSFFLFPAKKAGDLSALGKSIRRCTSFFYHFSGKQKKNTAARKSWNLFRSLRRCKGTYTADKSAPRG